METDKIILRKWRIEDAPILVKNLNDEKMAFNLGTKYPYTDEDANNYISDAISKDKEKYAIIYKKNMQIIGGCGLHVVGESVSGNIWITKEYHGMGLGTEASILLAEYCFKVLQIERMESVFFGGNIASKKMQEKIGSVVDNNDEQIVINGEIFIKKKAVLTKTNFKSTLEKIKGDN